MFKSPVLGFCDSEVMSDEKKLSHASDQGDFGLLVVIAHEMLVERLYALIVLDTVHTSEVQDLPEHWISCPDDFPSSIQRRSCLSSYWVQSRKCRDLISIRTRILPEEIQKIDGRDGIDPLDGKKIVEGFSRLLMILCNCFHPFLELILHRTKTPQLPLE